MSSGGAFEFSPAARTPTRMNNSNLTALQQFPFGSSVPDPTGQIHRPDFIGKRSLDKFQQQQIFLLQQQNQEGLGFNLRNVKPRPNYHHESPISPQSPVDFSPVSSSSSEISLACSVSSSLNSRYCPLILPQQRLQPRNVNYNISTGICFPNLGHARGFTNTDMNISGPGDPATESEKNMVNNYLRELEKQLLGDEEEKSEDVSVATNSEWSESILNLISTTQNPISPSPTSPSSSCCSTFASPPLLCSKQALIDAAVAIYEGTPEVAAEILTRLQQVAHARGTSEQRLAFYMVSALKSRVNSTENPTPASPSELHSKKHAVSTKLLYDFSPCFKLGFMAANLAIIEASMESGYHKIHVLDFEIAQGAQYVHFLHALAAKKNDTEKSYAASLKITAFTDSLAAGQGKLKTVGDDLKALANKIGVSLSFRVRILNITCLNREKLEIQSDEAVAVNLAFILYKLPDESVTTENFRDELLRRVKGLSPTVMTVVEQEMNTNTAPLTSRVRDTCIYYAALFDSLDATVSRDNPDRVKIEEGLGRRIGNSIACERRERVERCEVFGKWRARMSMAGFQPLPMSQLAVESLRSKLNTGTRGNPGFSVNEESGGICFGWLGRILAVASAWR